MIPARIRQILKATAIASAIALLCFLAYDRGAGITFGVTSVWMMANLVIWTIVMQMALQPGENKTSPGILLLAIGVKLLLLFGGVIALRVFAPYTRWQLYGIIAGVSSVLIVAVLKAAGARVAAMAKPSHTDKKQAAKV